MVIEIVDRHSNFMVIFQFANCKRLPEGIWYRDWYSLVGPWMFIPEFGNVWWQHMASCFRNWVFPVIRIHLIMNHPSIYFHDMPVTIVDCFPIDPIIHHSPSFSIIIHHFSIFYPSYPSLSIIIHHYPSLHCWLVVYLIPMSYPYMFPHIYIYIYYIFIFFPFSTYIYVFKLSWTMIYI